MHSLLRIYARQNNISITDAGNRIILGFLTKAYGFEPPGELRKRTLKAIFPTRRAFYDALVSLAHGKKPRRRLGITRERVRQIANLFNRVGLY